MLYRRAADALSGCLLKAKAGLPCGQRAPLLSLAEITAAEEAKAAAEARNTQANKASEDTKVVPSHPTIRALLHTDAFAAGLLPQVQTRL